MSSSSGVATCPACGEETFLRREPVYEGFRKVGEKRFCTACGHQFDDGAEHPTPVSRKPSIFGDEDAPEMVDVFDESERRRCCRYCRHYLVNPFVQRCALHAREVQATDLCDDFDRLEEDD